MANKLSLSTTSRAFGSVALYIQGPDEIKNIFSYCSRFGKNVLFLIDRGVLDLMRGYIECIDDKCGLSYSYLEFFGESCEKYVHELSSVVKERGSDVICALGGGKVLDTAKMVSDEADIPRIIVPTSASNDAPAANWAALYTEDGVHISGVPVRRCTDLVLVDSRIIANAPARLFAAGIGDAYATYYEAMANYDEKAPSYLGNYLRCCSTMGIAYVCKDILDRECVSAYNSVCKGELTPEVEDVIEANILMSGLGFVNAGCAGAHAYHSGISVIESTRNFLHGEKVAFGLICQMVYEGKSYEEILPVMELLYSVNLPLTMAQMNAEPSEKNLELIADHIFSSNVLIYHEPVTADKSAVKEALVKADELGRSFLESHQKH